MVATGSSPPCEGGARGGRKRAHPRVNRSESGRVGGPVTTGLTHPWRIGPGHRLVFGRNASLGCLGAVRHASKMRRDDGAGRILMHDPPPARGRMASLTLTIAMVTTGLPVRADSTRAEFFRGINLNGPPVVIDGNQWQGGDSKYLASRDQALENQAVPVDPADRPGARRMIRSSRWNSQADMKVTAIPAGTYSVFLYVWEDNNPETFSIALDGREVVHDYNSGPAGTWKQLGPWRVVVDSGSIRLTTAAARRTFRGSRSGRATGRSPSPGQPSGRRDPAGAAAFDAEIAPILARHCLECHGRSLQKGKLALMTEAVRPGRRRERAGHRCRASRRRACCWTTWIRARCPGVVRPLTDAEKRRLRRWIADGAEWGMPEIDPYLATTDRRAGYDWWSLQPVRDPAPPAVRDARWPRNGIDRFVLAQLEARDLHPAPEADRRTLIRRLSFDLTGLPPEPEEVERFTHDGDTAAYEKLVDRLLDSPHYGERWGAALAGCRAVRRERGL